MLAPAGPHADGTAERCERSQLDRFTGHEAELVQVAEDIGVVVRHPRDRRSVAGREVEQRTRVGADDLELAVRDRIAVGVVRRESERLVVIADAEGALTSMRSASAEVVTRTPAASNA